MAGFSASADSAKAMSAVPARITTLDEWFDALLKPTALIELAALVVCVLLAWLGAGESPGPNALTGGALVIGALLFNE